jgi:membrane protein
MSSPIDFFVRVYNFIVSDIWKIAENELTRTRRFFYNLIKKIILSINGYIIGRGFGMETLIEDALKNTFIAQANLVPVVMDFVKKYLESIQGGVFLGVGIVILLWAVVSFFMQVEDTFNSIWQVKKSRSFLRQFTTYFSIILILPVFIVLSSGFSIFVNSTISQIPGFQILNPLLKVGANLVPYLINWLIFTFMYLFIPNTQVRFINALIAGIIAGTAFQLFQILYITGQINLSRYNAVYGGFAAIPLLILWIRISCLIVLLGAELTYASQNIRNYETELDTQNISIRNKKFISLYITYLVIKQFELQKPPLSSEQIASDFKLPIRLVNQILNDLVGISVLIEVFNDKNNSKSYQPAMDINQLTVGLFFDKFESHGTGMTLLLNNEQLKNFWEKTSAVLDAGSKESSNEILIKDL